MDDVIAAGGNVLAIYWMEVSMGKGSGRRPGEGYAANWGAIFGNRKSDEVKGAPEKAHDGGEAQKYSEQKENKEEER